LKAANEKLQELDRLKSMFIASMSHELRTPLNAIIGFTGILLQGLAGPLNDEQQHQLGMVKSSSLHLLDLITDIIDISKIEANKISLNRESFDLSKMALEVLESFRPEAERKSLKLDITAPEKLRVESDKRRVRQILMNLMGNAVKFTPGGAVSVTVKKNEGDALVAVRDTGPGVRAADMAKLFQYFSQITSKDRPHNEGTGLGLYLSKKLATILGGDIMVDSEFGKGSVFTMMLPLQGKAGP
jgi:signal transduction histidine kinase